MLHMRIRIAAMQCFIYTYDWLISNTYRLNKHHVLFSTSKTVINCQKDKYKFTDQLYI